MMSDLRQAWRMIGRMPALSAVVIISLGVGIGVNTAVFSWIQMMVLQPIPGVADNAGVQLVEPRADTGSFPGASWKEYGDLHDRLRTLPDLFAYRMVPFNVGEAGRSERTSGVLISANYFSALGLKPALGRFLRADEAERAGGAPVVVISHAYWQTRFNGAASALGGALRVNDRTLTIVGVTPERFQGTVTMLAFDLWVPATMAPELFAGSRELEDRGQRGYSMAGRLATGASRSAAQTELDVAMAQLAHDYPETNKAITGVVLAFWQAPRGPQQFFISALAVLQAVLLLLLLAVCGNTANLMLARASARQREVGVRLTLGAGPWRVASLLLTENLLLAILGAALGAVIAVWATDAMRAVPMIASVPVKIVTRVDGLSFAVALGLGVISGLIFGAAPAAQLARLDPQVALRSGARTAGRNPMRNGLMAVEVGLALVVLMAAALFVSRFSATLNTDPGFRREGVLLAEYDLYGRNFNDAAASDFTARVLARLRALPGVESAAIASQVPLDIHGLPLRAFTLEGRARSDAAPDRALSNTVTPDYFRTMGIPLRRGQDFAPLEDKTTPPQAIVNDEFVRRFLPEGEPLGRRAAEPRSAVCDHRRRSQLAQRLVRRAGGAGAVLLVPRPAVDCRPDPPAHAPRQRDAARPGGRTRCPRRRFGGADLRRAHAHRSRGQEPVHPADSGADVRRARAADARARRDRHLRGRVILGVSPHDRDWCAPGARRDRRGTSSPRSSARRSGSSE